MDITLNVTKSGNYRYYTVTCGKRTLEAAVTTDRVELCFQNASSRLSRYGGGKVFHGRDIVASLEKAREGYRSSRSQAMVGAVRH